MGKKKMSQTEISPRWEGAHVIRGCVMDSVPDLRVSFFSNSKGSAVCY